MQHFLAIELIHFDRGIRPTIGHDGCAIAIGAQRSANDGAARFGTEPCVSLTECHAAVIAAGQLKEVPCARVAPRHDFASIGRKEQLPSFSAPPYIGAGPFDIDRAELYSALKSPYAHAV